MCVCVFLPVELVVRFGCLDAIEGDITQALGSSWTGFPSTYNVI